ncbi:MAG: NAD-glutamate dehydrogenase domain-containing protein [Candidatus Paceibacteria bacterium]
MFLNKDTLSFKINTKIFSKDLKGLEANSENFIYHINFYGIHLRMSKILRGRLRWFNRYYDYHQEVKSLMIIHKKGKILLLHMGKR